MRVFRRMRFTRIARRLFVVVVLIAGHEGFRSIFPGRR